MSAAHAPRASEVHARLRAAGIHADIEAGDESLGRRLRRVRGQRHNYTIVIGDAEVRRVPTHTRTPCCATSLITMGRPMRWCHVHPAADPAECATHAGVLAWHKVALFLACNLKEGVTSRAHHHHHHLKPCATASLQLTTPHNVSSLRRGSLTTHIYRPVAMRNLPATAGSEWAGGVQGTRR